MIDNIYDWRLKTQYNNLKNNKKLLIIIFIMKIVIKGCSKR